VYTPIKLVYRQIRKVYALFQLSDGKIF